VVLKCRPEVFRHCRCRLSSVSFGRRVSRLNSGFHTKSLILNGEEHHKILQNNCNSVIASRYESHHGAMEGFFTQTRHFLSAHQEYAFTEVELLTEGREEILIAGYTWTDFLSFTCVKLVSCLVSTQSLRQHRHPYEYSMA
jgi:hypothetical protein